MRVYVDQVEMQKELNKTPEPLRARMLAETTAHYADKGIVVKDGADGVFDIDISHANPAVVYEFMQALHVCALDIQPQDVSTYLGRGLDGFAVKRGLSQGAFNPALTERVMPEELIDRMQTFAIEANQATGNTEAPEYVRAAEEEQMVMEMRSAGIEVPDSPPDDVSETNLQEFERMRDSGKLEAPVVLGDDWWNQ